MYCDAVSGLKGRVRSKWPYHCVLGVHLGIRHASVTLKTFKLIGEVLFLTALGTVQKHKAPFFVWISTHAFLKKKKKLLLHWPHKKLTLRKCI